MGSEMCIRDRVEVGGHFYWDIYALYRHILDGLKLVAHRGESIASIGIDTWGVDFGLLGWRS